MQRECDVCGRPYEAKRVTSKYCSATCRVRASRGAKAGNVTPLKKPAGKKKATGASSAAAKSTGLVVRTRDQLETVKRLDTVAGQQALFLAEQFDGFHTGSALAALSKEFREVMAVALEGVSTEVDPLDELGQRRDAKLNAG